MAPEAMVAGAGASASKYAWSTANGLDGGGNVHMSTSSAMMSHSCTFSVAVNEGRGVSFATQCLRSARPSAVPQASVVLSRSGFSFSVCC